MFDFEGLDIENITAIRADSEIEMDRTLEEALANRQVGYFAPGKDIAMQYARFYNYQDDGNRCKFLIWDDGRFSLERRWGNTRGHAHVTICMTFYWLYDSGHKVSELGEFSLCQRMSARSEFSDRKLGTHQVFKNNFDFLLRSDVKCWVRYSQTNHRK
jgi:hypothetical protein